MKNEVNPKSNVQLTELSTIEQQDLEECMDGACLCQFPVNEDATPEYKSKLARLQSQQPDQLPLKVVVGQSSDFAIRVDPALSKFEHRRNVHDSKTGRFLALLMLVPSKCGKRLERLGFILE